VADPELPAQRKSDGQAGVDGADHEMGSRKSAADYQQTGPGRWWIAEIDGISVADPRVVRHSWRDTWSSVAGRNDQPTAGDDRTVGKVHGNPALRDRQVDSGIRYHVWKIVFIDQSLDEVFEPRGSREAAPVAHHVWQSYSRTVALQARGFGVRMMSDRGSQVRYPLTGHSIVPIGEPVAGRVDHRHPLNDARIGGGDGNGYRQTGRTRTDNDQVDISAGHPARPPAWRSPHSAADLRQPSADFRFTTKRQSLLVRPTSHNSLFTTQP
jgi:hypothetical protein